MSILFVCKWNQGRSQIAEALYRAYFPNASVVSVGTHTTKQNAAIPLQTCAPLVVRVLDEWGINVRNKYPKKLNRKDALYAQKIVVICDKSNLPKYLLASNKLIFWQVDDPDGKGYDYHIVMRDTISKLIKDTFGAK